MKQLFLSSLLILTTFLPAARAAGQAPKAVKLIFDPLPLPNRKDADNEILLTKGGLAVLPDGVKKPFTLGFQELFRTGDKDSRAKVAGALRNIKGAALRIPGGAPRVSPYADANYAYPLLSGDILLMTHLEDQPGGLMTALLHPNKDEFEPTLYSDIDTAVLGGTASNCAGAKTPWGTAIVSEEDYNNDALWFDPATKNRMPWRHINMCEAGENGKLTGKVLDEKFTPHWKWCESVMNLKDVYYAGQPGFSPYNFGVPFEVSVSTGGDAKILHGHKLFTLGKGSAEMALVMPDERTVYLPEDGGLRGLFMFVADQPKDLKAGALYMAKFIQEDGGASSSAKLEWIKLGHNTSAKLASHVLQGLSFSDFWELRFGADCPEAEGFRPILWDFGEPLCLRLKDGANGSTLSSKFKSADEFRAAAAFLEARRYGAYLGATAELHKAEAITYDPILNKLYLAVSALKIGMMKLPPQLAGLPDHIQFPRNDCGGVFELSLAQSKDIGSPHVAQDFKPLILGKPLAPDSPGADENACDPNLPAGPDNIRYIGAQTLLIGEDSEGHLHNAVWSFDTSSKALTRIATLPLGAQVTGSFEDLVWKDGETLLFVTAQGAFGERLQENAKREPVGKDAYGAATARDKQARLTVWRGLPLLGP